MVDGTRYDQDPPMKQTSFASAEFAGKKRQTRREKFLADMETVVPWARLEALIEPHYPKSGKVGRPPVGLSKMLACASCSSATRCVHAPSAATQRTWKRYGRLSDRTGFRTGWLIHHLARHVADFGSTRRRRLPTLAWP